MTRRFTIILLLLCVSAFAWGLFHLFTLRFEAGDIYPEYSSLRSDPLGTMIFYEGLEKMPQLEVRRDFSAEDHLPEGKETTYLHLAASRLDWISVSEELAREIDGFLARGGRLLITFLPESNRSARSATPPGTPTRRAGKQPSGPTESELQRISLKERWGMEIGFVPLERGGGGSHLPAQAVNRTDLPLPAALDWHSGTVLTNLDSSWRVIYARGTKPVVAERKFGPGTLLLATDSYFLSNEALSKNPRADLLAWFVGPGKRVVFDEAHFGIIEQSGVATLMRKYRLGGLGAALLVLAGLFIWKNSVSFVPPQPAPQETGLVAGREAAAGFVNLLRRNITPRELLRVCFDEWTKSILRGRSYPISRVDQAQAVLEAETARAHLERNPVRAYREICEVLKGTRTDVDRKKS